MRLRTIVALVGALVTSLGGVRAQDDPILGTWRGTLTAGPGPGSESTISLTIVQRDGRYEGVTTALGGTAEIELADVAVDGSRLAIEVASSSDLGVVSLSGDLMADGAELTGTGTLAVGDQEIPVTFALQRRLRADVPQPQVDPGLDFFIGQWRFEYLGGEFPPLSVGTRMGTVRFSFAHGGDFVTGELTADVYGEEYRERVTIGFDPEASVLLWQETRSHGADLASVGNWQSPIAINFITAPIEEDGRVYRLRRRLAVRSETSFAVVEEFSIDDGAYQRLGNGQFLKVE